METSIDPHYLATAGIPLLRGRWRDELGFDERNPRTCSVLISEAMAKEVLPNEDRIGKRIFFDYALERAKLQRGTPVPHYEVIGIVGDVPPLLDQKVQPALYLPLLDGAYSGATILLHTAAEPRSLIAAAQRQIQKLDPTLAVYDVRTMEEIIGRSASGRQFSMLLFGAFAGLAVLLAAVTSLVLKQGLKPAAAAIVLALTGALLTSRVLESLLFGVKPIDALTFAQFLRCC
jgi:putative ABC transport system permease protein